MSCLLPLSWKKPIAVLCPLRKGCNEEIVLVQLGKDGDSQQVDSFENTQWRKVKQMQPKSSWILFEGTFETNSQAKDLPAKNPLTFSTMKLISKTLLRKVPCAKLAMHL